MRIKLDEDFSESLIDILQQAGHQCRTVVGQAWGGISDADLWPRIVSEQVFFITADKGFGDIRLYPPGSHPGILVLRPSRESLYSFRDLVKDILSRYTLDEWAGCLVVATSKSVRIRRK